MSRQSSVVALPVTTKPIPRIPRDQSPGPSTLSMTCRSLHTPCQHLSHGQGVVGRFQNHGNHYDASDQFNYFSALQLRPHCRGHRSPCNPNRRPVQSVPNTGPQSRAPQQALRLPASFALSTPAVLPRPTTSQQDRESPAKRGASPVGTSST